MIQRMWSRKSPLELRLEAIMGRLWPGLAPGVKLVLQAGDPDSALEQLVPLRAASRGSTGGAPDAPRCRAEAALAGMTGHARGE
jgi:hypothetical protein